MAEVYTMIGIVIVLLLMSDTLSQDLERADFNRPAWEAVISACDGIDADRARYLLTELPVKDLYEADPLCIMNHVRGVAINHIPDYSVPEDSLRKFVLWPTVAYWHHMDDWRPFLRERMIPFIRDDLETTIHNMLEWFNGSIRIEERKDLFGPPSAPVATLKRGWGSPTEAAGLFVAMLRSLGVAARLGSGSTEVQYYDGSRWNIALSLETDGNPMNDANREIILPNATLVLTLTRDGEPYLNEEAVGLARWKDGRWEPVMPHILPIEFSTTDSTIIIRTVSGTYLVTVGIRNARGEPRIWRSTVEIFPDRKTSLDVALDIPFSELRTDDLIRGNIPDLKNISISTTSAGVRELLSFVGQSPVLFALVADGAEPSERFLNDLADHESDLDAIGLQTVIIGSDSSSVQRYTDSSGGFAGALQLLKNDRIVESRLPVILLYDVSGALILKQEGYSSTYIDLVEYILDHESG